MMIIDGVSSVGAEDEVKKCAEWFKIDRLMMAQ